MKKEMCHVEMQVTINVKVGTRVGQTDSNFLQLFPAGTAVHGITVFLIFTG